jgi:hypothetical protein
MPGSKSNYLENKLLDHVYGGPDYPRPATVYVALFTAAPTDSGGGTEVSGPGYARVGVTNNATNWPASSGGSKSNGTTITFPTATGAWGSVGSFATYDSESGGNLLHWGTVDTPKSYDVDDVASFPPGTLVFTED